MAHIVSHMSRICVIHVYVLCVPNFFYVLHTKQPIQNIKYDMTQNTNSMYVTYFYLYVLCYVLCRILCDHINHGTEIMNFAKNFLLLKNMYHISNTFRHIKFFIFEYDISCALCPRGPQGGP